MDEAKLWYTTKADDTVHRVVEAIAVRGGGSNVKSADSKNREANEGLAIFIGLLSASPILGADGKMEKFTPAIFTDEVKEVFGSISKSAEQAPMVVDNMSSFAEEISLKRGPLVEQHAFLSYRKRW